MTVLTNGINGIAFAWSQVVDLLATVQAAGFDPNAVIANPRAIKSAALLVDTIGQPLVAPALAADVPIPPTLQVPTNLTVGSSTDTAELYAGQWDELVIGFRPQVGLEIDRIAGPSGMIGLKQSQERYIDTMEVGVLCFLRADVAVLHTGALAVSTGSGPDAGQKPS